jgi:hypothetical protein
VLQGRFGDRFVVFRPRSRARDIHPPEMRNLGLAAVAELSGKSIILDKSTAETISVLQEAELVIASHGGALYKALRASRDCRVVKIMPLLRNRAYPDHASTDQPPKSGLPRNVDDELPEVL